MCDSDLHHVVVSPLLTRWPQMMLDGPQSIFKTLSWQRLDTLQACCGDTMSPSRHHTHPTLFLSSSVSILMEGSSLYSTGTHTMEEKLYDETTCVTAGMLRIYAVGFHHPAPPPPAAANVSLSRTFNPTPFAAWLRSVYERGGLKSLHDTLRFGAALTDKKKEYLNH